MTIDIRRAAVLSVRRIIDQSGYASLVISQTLDSFGPQADDRDRRFYTNLVYTTVSHRETIDGYIAASSKVSLKKMDSFVRNVLRVGVCQLLYFDEVRPYAAVNESVRLVRSSRLKNLAPFSNAVLRSVQRTIEGQDQAKSKGQASPDIDLPGWVLEGLVRDYGEKTAQKIKEGFSGPHPLCLRINRLKGPAAGTMQAIRQWADGKADIIPGSAIPEAVFLIRRTGGESLGNIEEFDAYRQGMVTVQDESSMIAASLVEAGPNDKVLDLCAAPGGKSLMMADRMDDRGLIVSRDIHPGRVRLIRENAARMGASIIRAEVSDATRPRPEDKAAFDKVLLDAPCSGLGIVRSKPDILLHRRKEDLEQLETLQSEMLETAAQAVRTGGRLVYSTCTLRKKENQDQVAAFLSRHPEFTLIDLEKEMTENGSRLSDAVYDRCLTMLPVAKGREGFFAAAMIRTR